MAVGYNNIDVEAATGLGIPVANTPGVLTETTADFGFALMMAIVGGPEGLAGLFDKAYDKVVDKVRR